jgi:hypothetical protein
MMGSVGGASWRRSGGSRVRRVALTALVAWARDVDALALGEEPAAALGVDVDARCGASSSRRRCSRAARWRGGARRVRRPRGAAPRRAAGARAHRALVPAAALAGATLVVAADLAARTVRAPVELRSARSRPSWASVLPAPAPHRADDRHHRRRARRVDHLRRRRAPIPARRPCALDGVSFDAPPGA